MGGQGDKETGGQGDKEELFMPNAQCPMPNSEHIYLFIDRCILWKFLKYQDP
ncbi:hypothetical protein H6G81_11735 [Scytonema hofmannii FACHB-248]|uniref:Uncharacterized protein n=1 Tax=Scytonema hofmannii FACHB-248 TaxID=1842502 RepID=A0ABR8GPX8_9CYAN|nr:MULTISPECIES: hypothetical protein [Nostocales]MBD2605185.1 hypothetical protein [Scytonema hofmannii FACHB-248]